MDFSLALEERMKVAAVAMIIFIAISSCMAQDWRDASLGTEIYTNGYIDQPYVVVLEDGTWLCVFTTGAGHEGSGGQHIVCSLSSDHGKSWSDLIQIEEPGEESASWALPYLTDYGRVYVFYDYNGDKIHHLGERENIREDMLGWYCYKFSDDRGKSWSRRYRLPVRLTSVDDGNDWNGEVQILWGIGKPIDVNGGMMFGFTKIGEYMLDKSEGWFFRCDNINVEKDPEKLEWIMLPEGEVGLRNRDLFGPINAEQNIVQLKNGTIYCMYRTISGHPAESYSDDFGVSWTLPAIPENYTGRLMKNPRACPRIWKCSNGNYLFWYHNHGGWNFKDRNPAWISGGIEEDGKIIWSQPEVLLFEQDPEVRMSYPDLIEQNGRYWVTETNKEHGRCHEIPEDFLNTLWSQFELASLAENGLVYDLSPDELSAGSRFRVSGFPAINGSGGITIDFQVEIQDLTAGQLILDNLDDAGRGFKIETGEYGSIVMHFSDGEHTGSCSSDGGLIKAYGETSVGIVVDNGPAIIQFVINGIVCDGGTSRQFGWDRFDRETGDVFRGEWTVGDLASGQLRPKGKLNQLRIYNRALMNTELIGNHRFMKNNTTVSLK